MITPVAIVCLLIAPANLSTALLIGATSFMLLFIGRVSAKHLLLTIAVMLDTGWFADTGRHFPATVQTLVLLKKPKTETRSRLFVRVDTWINRVETFIYGGKDVNNEDNYQVNQAKIAIANGGIMGLGPGNSLQRNFLPHPYSDFIYAIIIEEYGVDRVER